MAEEETVAWPQDFLPVAKKKVFLEGTGEVSSAELWGAALRQHLAIFTRSGKRFWIPEHDKGGYLARDYAQYVDGFRGKLEVKPISHIKAQEMRSILAAEERILSVKKSAELAAESLLKEETKQSRATPSNKKPSNKQRKKAKERQQKTTGEPSTLDVDEPEPDEGKTDDIEKATGEPSTPDVDEEPDEGKTDDIEKATGEPSTPDVDEPEPEPDEGKTDDIEKAGMSYEGWQLQLEGKRKPVAIEDLIRTINTGFETMKKEFREFKGDMKKEFRELKGDTVEIKATLPFLQHDVSMICELAARTYLKDFMEGQAEGKEVLSTLIPRELTYDVNHQLEKLAALCLSVDKGE